jgi:hypothetical protein
MVAKKLEGDTGEFLGILEKGVKAVLNNSDATSGEKVAAIAAGVKIAIVRYRISGDSEKGFFDS